MSAFLALTLKSSRKSASMLKGDRDPRNEHVWTDRKISKDCFKTRYGTGIHDLPFVPHSSVRAKKPGG